MLQLYHLRSGTGKSPLMSRPANVSLVFHAFMKTGTPEELAAALGLPGAAAKEWQVQHVLVKRLKEVARRQKITHAEIARRAGTSRTRVTAILNDDLDHVSSDPLIRILYSLGYRVKVSVVRAA